MNDLIKCEICEHWSDDVINGICVSCIDGVLDTVTLDDVIAYVSTLDEKEELVFYTQYLFNRDDAIEILQREAKNVCKLDSRIFEDEIKEFINNDTYHYLDYLKEKGEL